MKKLLLLVSMLIICFVLSSPIDSQAELIMTIQPYEGYSFLNPPVSRDLEVGERLVVDILWFNFISALNPEDSPTFNPISWTFRILYNDTGMNFLSESDFYIDRPIDEDVNPLYPYVSVETGGIVGGTGGTIWVTGGNYRALAQLNFEATNPGSYMIGIDYGQGEGIYGGFWGGFLGTTGFTTVNENIYQYITVVESSSTPVPEPTTMLLLATGLIGVAGFRRKFKNSHNAPDKQVA